MAVSIPRQDLSPDQAVLIRKYLCLQSKTSDFVASRYETEQTPPILFYLVRDDHVLIPYTFAKALLKQPINTHSYPSITIQFRGTLRPEQVPVVEEVRQHLQQYGTTTLGVHTGFGKTAIGTLLTCDLGLMTVVLVPREHLGPQWGNSYQKFTTATVWIVGQPVPDRVPDVIICLDTRYHLIPEEYRKAIGCLIIDEAHLFCTPSRVECLLAFQPRYVIAETATLERVDGMHTMIHALCGTHGIFRISQKPFHVIKIETGITPPDERNSHGGIDWDKMMKYFNQHPIRNQLILSIIQQNKSHKILLLTGYKEQAKILLEALRQQGESVDYMIGTKKTYSDSRILIGTISKIGTGFDEESACANFNGIRLDLLILCTSIKNAARLEQSVGRVFRAEFPTFIDLVDNHAICKNHWYERRKWYLDPRRNGTIAEQKLDLQTLAIQPKPTKKEKNQKGEKEETVPQTMILARQQVQRLRQQAGSSIPLPHLLSSSSSSI